MQLNPIYYNEQHIAFADNVRRFVQKEMAPFVNEWDEAETFPRELYKKAAEIGLLGLGFSEEYGGIPDADPFYSLLAGIEMAKGLNFHLTEDMFALRNSCGFNSNS